MCELQQLVADAGDVGDAAEVRDRVLLAPKSFSQFPKNRIAQARERQKPAADTLWQHRETRVENCFEDLCAGGREHDPAVGGLAGDHRPRWRRGNAADNDETLLEEEKGLLPSVRWSVQRARRE